MSKQLSGMGRMQTAIRRVSGSWVEAAMRTRLSRRELHQKLLCLGGAAAATLHLPAQAAGDINSGSQNPCLYVGGYPTPAFVDALPLLHSPERRACPVTQLVPQPGRAPATGEARRDPHQGWATYPPQEFYEIIEEEVQAKLHRDMPFNTLWGYRRSGDQPGTALVPGPTFYATYGKPILVRIRNNLPAYNQHYGFAMPETTTHLHNNHTPWESDGNPDQYFPKMAELDPAHLDAGRFKDHLYVNLQAGHDKTEALGTPVVPRSSTRLHSAQYLQGLGRLLPDV